MLNDISDYKNNLILNGKCKSLNSVFKGVDLKRVASQIDDLDTFQKFTDIMNIKKMTGTSEIQSIIASFTFRKNLLQLENFKAVQENVVVKSYGEYLLESKKFVIKNKFFVKTKKYKNLPPFGIKVSGTPDNYKMKYDIKEIRSILLTEGLNSILKEKKKITIDPNSLKKIFELDELEKEFKPEKLLDLFLN
tara:strand:- start:96 stop:671 length:576 start_codon:yes stop_codon:yes gene_type:complete